MIGVKTILLVENDLVALTMYSDRLAREGFHVSTAEDGETALRQLETSSVDLVVLDLMLPTLSGAEVFKRMRSDQRLASLPVIIFSNATLPEWPENIAVGPTKCLLKSDTTFAMLLETIHESMNAAAMASAGIQTSNGSLPVNGQTPGNNALTSATEAAPASNAPSNERAEFLKEAVAELPKIREYCFGYIKAPTSTASSQHLATLTDRIEVLRTRATQLGCGRVALLATPFNTLLSELAAKPAKATPSILQTIAQAVDCLGLVLRSSDEGEGETMLAPQALVVDDDPVSNQVNVTALQQASFETTSIDDPLTALEILATTEFDLIVLDINMPNLTGFEVCEKLRRLPQAKTTPVIFLTAFNNFENRKQSVLSGGGDFISKPVSVRELALKATIHLLKAQVRNSRKANPEAPGSAAAPQATAKSERPSTQPISSNTLVSATESATTASETPTVAAPAAPTREPVLVGATAGTGPVNSGASPQFAPHSTSQSAPAPSAHQHSALLERNAVVESELKTLRSQLETAAAATLQAQTSCEERTTRCKQLEDELAGLRRNHEELQTKLQQASNELQTTKSGADTLATDRARIESELREQIAAAKLASEKTSAALKEKEEWCEVLEKEIAPLRKLGETLTQQSTVMGVELEKARAEAQRELAERTRIESELRAQLATASQQSEQANARAKEHEDRVHVLQQEIATLRPAHDQARQKHEATTGELERLKAELDKITSDRARSEADLHQKLAAANQQAEQANVRTKEQEQRVHSLEQEIAALRPAHDQAQQKHEATAGEVERLKAELDKINSDRARSEADLRQQLTTASQQAEQAIARAKEHEAKAGEAAHLKAELDKAAAERTKSESELRDQLNAAKATLETTTSALKQKDEWCQLLEEEMGPLRDVSEQLRQERQQKTALEQAKTELEQKAAEHSRIEADLRNQAMSSKSALEKAENVLREKEEWFRLLEEELAPLRQVRLQFQQHLTQHQQTVDELARVKAELDKYNTEHASAHSELEKERAQRQHLEKRAADFHGRLQELRAQFKDLFSAE